MLQVDHFDYLISDALLSRKWLVVLLIGFFSIECIEFNGIPSIERYLITFSGELQSSFILIMLARMDYCCGIITSRIIIGRSAE